jgi:hypothetical protein
VACCDVSLEKPSCFIQKRQYEANIALHTAAQPPEEPRFIFFLHPQSFFRKVKAYHSLLSWLCAYEENIASLQFLPTKILLHLRSLS